MKSKRHSNRDNVKLNRLNIDRKSERRNNQQNKSKSKSKSKSKKKVKKFNPISYLNTLIDLQNTVYFSNKKKQNTKRNLSSALTVATPIL